MPGFGRVDWAALEAVDCLAREAFAAAKTSRSTRGTDPPLTGSAQPAQLNRP
jgi:hypothetical protein